jgi:hypothetical protein
MLHTYAAFPIFVTLEAGIIGCGSRWIGFGPNGFGYPATGLLVHRGPGSPLRFAPGDTAFFISLFDVLGLTLLLIGVRGLVASWHDRDLQLGYAGIARVRGHWDITAGGAVLPVGWVTCWSAAASRQRDSSQSVVAIRFDASGPFLGADD